MNVIKQVMVNDGIDTIGSDSLLRIGHYWVKDVNVFRVYGSVVYL